MSSRAVLYAGVALFVVLAAFTARSIWTAWQARSGEARAEAVFDLVEQRTPLRPTEAPGAMAWLRLELEKYGRHVSDVERARLYRSFAARGDRVPVELQGVQDALRMAITLPVDGTVRLPAPVAHDRTSLREERLAQAGGRTLAVTRRRSLATSDAAASDRFVSAVGSQLAEASRRVDERLTIQPLPGVPGDRPPRPVRVYAVSEDGTLVSAPWAEPERELALLSARPNLPTFAPEEFFFRFDPAAGGAVDAAYSGFYLDLGGRGLVSTVMLPLVTRDGQRGVVALDLAFEIDWHALAAAVDPPVVGTALRLAGTNAASSSSSWTTLAGAMGAEVPARLRAAVEALSSNERRASAANTDSASPLRHGVVESVGAVAAFQVSDSTWLLMFFPRAAPAFPFAALALLAGLAAVLLGGFEVNRRRAETERRNAERAFAEKQNLLETMQVPIVVVDPNSDVIVSSNRAAESIGVRAGSRFADHIWPDARARAHYEKMQVASREPRRAYGVPMAVLNERGEVVERHAVVRSVAVTAPIAALSADERHRLGVLFLLEPDADLALFADEIEQRAQRDERRRLSGLLSHGVETLARVLEHCLSQRESGADMREFTAWLADYLERRLTVAAWLLDHWDASPPLPRESVVDGEQARATLARFESIFAQVGRDRELRARLHWDNGTLSAPSADGRMLDARLDWPREYEITCPVRGGFGLFVGEVLANAIRHGQPGDVPRVVVTCDRVRKELAFQVENRTSDSAGAPRGETYGGIAILKALARLFEWRDLTFESIGGRFVVRWIVPASERSAAGQAD